jgi:8-oxo-dGTP pyrophosphatase MutT (NUDIX family)
MIWKPHMTVAAVIEQDGRFLLVQECIHGKSVLNQPAGHLEDDESLLAAVIRETYEETGWHLEPGGITGIYRWREPAEQQTFIRVAFRGQLLAHDAAATLDDGIEQTLWLTPAELEQQRERLRSPMVLRCIQDYLGGACYSLDLLNEVE